MNLLKKLTQFLIFLSISNINCAKLLNKKISGLESAFLSNSRDNSVIYRCDLLNNSLTKYHEHLNANLTLQDLVKNQISPRQSSLIEKCIEKVSKDRYLMEKCFYSNDKDTQELIANKWYQTNKNLILEYLFKNNLIEKKVFEFQNTDFLLSLENFIIAASKNGVLYIINENYNVQKLDLRECLNHEEIINLKVFDNLSLIYSNSKIILIDKEIQVYNQFTNIINVEFIDSENLIITTSEKYFRFNIKQFTEVDCKRSNFNNPQLSKCKIFTDSIKIDENIFLNRPIVQLNDQIPSRHSITINHQEISNLIISRIYCHIKLANGNTALATKYNLVIFNITNSVTNFLSQGTGLINLRTISEADKILQTFKTS